MTIIEASGLLLKWFGNNNSFEISSNYQNLMIVTDKPIAGVKTAIILALEEMETAGVLKSKEIKEGKETKKYWILKKSFAAFDQTVNLDLETCINIADTLNKYQEKTKDFSYVSDPLNINRLDIQRLNSICYFLLGLNKEDKKD